MEFIDYPQEQLQLVLERVTKLEQGPMKNSPRVQAWKRWATDPEYRYNEWLWRQRVAGKITSTL